MLEKVSGRASYAVLSFGGLLGIGDHHYPLPWQALTYDTSVGVSGQPNSRPVGRGIALRAH